MRSTAIGSTPNRRRLAALWILAVVSAAGVAPAPAAPPTADPAPPNVVLILADDLGWTDTSVQMDPAVPDSKSDFHETPRLERLARSGMRFSAAYSAAPICSPSRASIQTGRAPWRLGLNDIIESQPGSSRYANFFSGQRLLPPLVAPGLASTERTIAELLKSAHGDYATAHFGKWHLGAGGPAAHGYEASDGSRNNDDLVALSQGPDPKSVFGLTGRALEFMRRQVANRRPFFVQISHYAVHTPERARVATLEKYRRKAPGRKHHNVAYAAMVEDLDDSVGQLLDGLESLGVADRTFVIFTSDNGGSMSLEGESTTSNAPLSRGKTSVYEGGIRVPLIVAGPGIKPGAVSSEPIVGWDLLPTICAMAGCTQALPRGLDGGDALGVMQGRTRGIDRPGGDTLVWSFPHYLVPRGTTPQTAIRQGPYKLVRLYEGPLEHLFDVVADPGEKADLAALRPEVTRQLGQLLDRRLAEAGVLLPQPNAAWMSPPSPERAARELAAATCCAGLERVALGQRVLNDTAAFSFRVPTGWFHQPEGLTDWLAPAPDQFFWSERFDPERTQGVAVATVNRFLSMDDRKAGRTRALSDHALAEIHLLQSRHDARLLEPPRPIGLPGRQGIVFRAVLGARHHCQLFVRLEGGLNASVTATGGAGDWNDLCAIASAIAASIEPAAK